VDGVDQSVSGGPFLWTRKATTTVHGIDLSAGIVDAEHNGYQRLKAAVRHRRWLFAPPEDPTVLVVDLLTGEGQHDIRVSWPVHPAVDAVAGAGDPAPYVLAHPDGQRLHLAYASSGRMTGFALRGDADSDLGWWSDRLESRQPSWLLGVAGSAGMPLVVATTLHVAGPEPAPSALEVGHNRDNIVVTWVVGKERRRVEINPASVAAVRQTSGTPNAPVESEP
jgi:hypothetical protein